MSPRTPLIPLVLAAAAVLLGACGEPPQPLPSSPPYAPPSAAPISIGPSGPMLPTGLPDLPTALPTTLPTGLPTGLPTPPIGGYPTGGLPPAQPPRTTTTTTAPETISPTPTPSHAAKCPAEPTGAQILELIKGRPGIPAKPMRVFEGPFCSGTWSFATVEATGDDADDLEPLMVVATGTGPTLALVAAGSDVCISRVQTGAPPGIRVLACGF
ncbi:hypothetical protein [Actinoplanes sp. URMC 104]|uniref:hypothetical protein n=1 Tax=Actinoplanes sp. URMC 104 TaxID=3423409 RepID=UPI003F1CE32E